MAELTWICIGCAGCGRKQNFNFIGLHFDSQLYRLNFAQIRSFFVYLFVAFFSRYDITSFFGLFFLNVFYKARAEQIVEPVKIEAKNLDVQKNGSKRKSLQSTLLMKAVKRKK